MKITPQTIRQACNLLAETLIAKNQDYGNSVEEQFQEYGETSLHIRCDDKIRRLKQLHNNPAQVNEKKAETILDLAGYSVLGHILLSSEGEMETLPLLDMNYTEQDSVLGPGFLVKYHDQDDQY